MRDDIAWASEEWLTSVDEEVRGAALLSIERLGQEHGALALDLLRIASEEDPIDLVGSGAPPTEYAHEVREVMRRLQSVRSVHELASLLHGVFVEMFDKDLAGPPDRYTRMAERMWAAVQRDERQKEPE